MGGAMLLFQVFVPLLLFATASSSEKKVFVLRGGSIVLQAKQVTRISSIIWKHNKDKAAEWFKGDNEPTYYNIFTSVTTLDMQTWALTISNLQPHFSGKYSAEVNNKDPTQFVTLNVFGPVSKPTITMDCIDTNCTLTCEGKKDGFTKYTWANGIEEWPGSELTVERRDHDVVYTCNISNPVSWASSIGTVKTHVTPPPGLGPANGVGIGVVIAELIIGAWIQLQLVFKKQGPVSKPTITMDCIDTICTLTCQGKEDGFTMYTWANGIEKWTGSELTVKRRDHDVVYTCNISNPVSWASSHRTVKKHVPPPPVPGCGTAIGVLVVVVLLLIAVLIIRRLQQVLKRKGKSLTDLWTMSSQDRADIWRSCISCNNERKKPGDEEKQEMTKPVTSQGPPGEHKSPEVVPLMPSVTGK